MFESQRGSFFDPDTPPPAKPYDNQRGGPPKRICMICGAKYVYEAGKDSPCGHVKMDGTLDL